MKDSSDIFNLDDICDRFEQAWKGPSLPPGIGAFLSMGDTGQRAELLELLIPIDIEYRTRHGLDSSGEHYHAALPEYRAHLNAILGAAESVRASNLQTPPYGMHATREHPVGQIGPYRLLKKLGEGGMGTVFLAEQHSPVRRKVALKLIKPGLDTKEVIARFEVERQALAAMDHPNIARVYDAGTTGSGKPFFVMEFVQGIPITKYCDKKRLSTRQRLELLMAVCNAIQHAHQKGIIHRDLKPSNVLVTQLEDHPAPKVIDFGVAKVAPVVSSETVFTRFGQVVGTLEYMSPEQAQLNQIDVDTRADIYSLGVLLYELLTSRTPVNRDRLRELALDEILKVIREEEILVPSAQLHETESLSKIAANRSTEPKKLYSTVRGDLDWIAMKALEKDRARRYVSANGLAIDILHYLKDEPIEARPPSAVYQLRKFVLRNKTVLIFTFSLLVSLLLGMIGTSWYAYRMTVAQRNETKLRKDAEKLSQKNAALANERQGLLTNSQESARSYRNSLYTAQFFLIGQAWESGDLATVRQLLEAQVPGPGEEDLRSFEWYYFNGLLNRGRIFPHGYSIDDIRCSSDGKYWASVGSNVVRIYKSGEANPSFQYDHKHARYIRFSRDGKYLASYPGNIGGSANSEVQVWSLAPFELTLKFDGSVPAFARDASRIATTLGSEIVLYDLVTQSELARFKHQGVKCIDFSPNGSLLASGGSDKFVHIWDLGSLAKRESLLHDNLVFAAEFWQDENSLFSAARGKAVRLWDLESGQERKFFKGQARFNTESEGFVFSKDRQKLALLSNYADGARVDVWNMQTGAQISQLRRRGRISAAFVGNAMLAVGAGQSRIDPKPLIVELVDINSSKSEQLVRLQHDGRANSIGGVPLAVSESSGRLFCSNTVDVLELEIPTKSRQVATVNLNENDAVHVVSGEKLLNLSDKNGNVSIGEVSHDLPIGLISISTNGDIVATRSGKNEEVIDLGLRSENRRASSLQKKSNAQRSRYGKRHAVLKLFPDGQRFVLGTEEVPFQLGSLNGDEPQQLEFDDIVVDASVSNSGFIAALSEDSKIWLFDAENGVKKWTVDAQFSRPHQIGFSADEQLLFSLSYGGIEIRRTTDGTLQSKLEFDRSPRRSAATFMGSRSVLIANAAQQEISEFDLTTKSLSPSFVSGAFWLERKWLPIRAGEQAQNGNSSADIGDVSAIAVSISRELGAVGSEDGRILIWNTSTNRAVARFRALTMIKSLCFLDTGELAVGADRVYLLNVEVGRVESVHAMQSPVAVWNAEFDRSGKLLATAYSLSSWVTSSSFHHDEFADIKIWETATGTEISHIRRDSRVRILRFIPGTDLIAIEENNGPRNIGSKRQLAFFDTRTGRFTLAIDAIGSLLAVSPSGTWLAFSNGLYSLQDRKFHRALAETASDNSASAGSRNRHVSAATFAPSEDVLITGDNEGQVTILSISNSDPPFSFKAHGEAVTDIKICPDGRTFATASKDGLVRLWDRESQNLRLSIEGNGVVRRIEFSPDGKTMAFLDGDGLRILRGSD